MTSALVAVPPALSVACTVKLNVPSMVGVPLRNPLMVSSEKPGGSWLPLATYHKYDPAPPFAVITTVRLVPNTALIGEGVVTETGWVIRSEKVFDTACCGTPCGGLSVTCTVKLKVPVVVGVPVRDPFVASVSPAGKLLPGATIQ